MRSLPTLTMALAIVSTAVAQNCNGPATSQSFVSRADFDATAYFENAAFLFDLDVRTAIGISGIGTWLYDQGIGNPAIPSQVGTTGTVEVYTCPTTRLGNETKAPGSPGSPWTLLGTGTLTVAAAPGESPIVFAPPLALAAGQYGVAVRFLPTTSGANPGPLHCLGVNPNPGIAASDAFVTLSNDGIQASAWTGIGVGSPNVRLTYTPNANGAYSTTLGSGCYARPRAFYEVFAPSTSTTPDLANTAQSWVFTGSNYVVTAGGPAFTAPGGTVVNASAPGVSACGASCWDDALSTPITLPFSFPFPGGSTNQITIASNGGVYLAAVTGSSWHASWAPYGDLLPFRDGAPRIAAFCTDLDVGAGGAIRYEVLGGGQSVRITWSSVPEWPAVPGFANDIQVTLDASGSVNLAYGALSNRSVALGNSALYGFTPGNGSALPDAMDISAALPFTSGDGVLAPRLAMDARPVLGTTTNLVTTQIVPGTLVQALAVGDTVPPAPVDLASIGMPGCLLQLNATILLTNAVNPNNTFTQPLAIPNNPVFQGASLLFQAAPLTAGFNSMGLLLSNGVCMRMGL